MFWIFILFSSPAFALTEGSLTGQLCPTVLMAEKALIVSELHGNSTYTDRPDKDTDQSIIQCTTCSIRY
jgi:hypothetical protein